MNVFIFYRDIRLYDNLGVLEMMGEGKIIPIYILERREWKSKNQYQFLLESLMDLDRQLRERGSRLSVMTMKMIKKWIVKTEIKSIGWNIDVAYPNRYEEIKRILKPTTRVIENMDDGFLIPPEEFVKKHKPFKKFTPFYRYCQTHFRVNKPQSISRNVFGKMEMGRINVKKEYEKLKRKNNHFYIQSGYRNALKRLNETKKTLKEYGKTRNYLYLPTSYLSAYLSLGVLSIRQVYNEMKNVSDDFIRELYWREFYLYVAKYFVHILKHRELKPLSPKKRERWIEWRDGKTGIPIVDACMNQMNTTGYMHNRGRMIVASYLIKDLHIPFQYGEDYFEHTLVDYNLPSNNGGWQWVNGTGIDSQPPYQKFNMYLQNKKYDPNCIFIKTWIPSLRNSSIQDIFNLYHS